MLQNKKIIVFTACLASDSNIVLQAEFYSNVAVFELHFQDGVVQLISTNNISNQCLHFKCLIGNLIISQSRAKQ